jgi:hypothetical protein
MEILWRKGEDEPRWIKGGLQQGAVKAAGVPLPLARDLAISREQCWVVPRL